MVRVFRIEYVPASVAAQKLVEIVDITTSGDHCAIVLRTTPEYSAVAFATSMVSCVHLRHPSEDFQVPLRVPSSVTVAHTVSFLVG
jgi:hypothetical protein